MTTTANFTGGPGTFVIADDAPLAIRESMGALGKGIPGSTAASLNAIATALVGVNNQQNNGTESLTSIQSAIADLDASLQITNAILAQILATQQIAVAQQIDKDEFDKAATQAALKRNNLPEVTVPAVDLQTQVNKSVKGATNVAAAAAAGGAVTTAIAGTASYLGNVTGVTAGLKAGQTWVKGKIESGLSAIGINPTNQKSNAQAVKTETEVKAKTGG